MRLLSASYTRRVHSMKEQRTHTQTAKERERERFAFGTGLWNTDWSGSGGCGLLFGGSLRHRLEVRLRHGGAAGWRGRWRIPGGSCGRGFVEGRLECAGASCNRGLRGGSGFQRLDLIGPSDMLKYHGDIQRYPDELRLRTALTIASQSAISITPTSPCSHSTFASNSCAPVTFASAKWLR